jgi:crotonobetainyl-CoA:carnitine CoA-transferase CaiB-like acyl-CoA transferase
VLTAFQHPILGEIKMPSIVPRLSETPGAIEWLGRGLGEDTSSVLGRALNYSAERLAELRSRGVI